MSTFAAFAADFGIAVKPLEESEDEDFLDLTATFYSAFSAKFEHGSRNGAPMVLDIYVMDEPGLNAFAGSFDDADVIVVNRDVPNILRATSRALVSHGLLLPELRSAGIESEPARAAGTPLDALHQPQALPGAPLVDPIRENLALAIFRTSGLYILLHELAHIYNGHVDWLASQAGVPLVAQLDQAGLATQPGLERETLEWDADCISIQDCLSLVLQPEVSVVDGRSVWRLSDRSLIGTIDQGVQVVSVAALICALYFSSQDSADPFDASPRTHPHPLFRALSFIGVATNILAFRTGVPLSKVTSAFDALAPLFHSWMRLFPGSHGVDVQLWKSAELHNAHVVRLNSWEATWARLRVELDPLKRGGTLAPSTPVLHPAFLDNQVLG